MHLLLGKRQLVLGSLVVALGLAVFVNWYYTNTDIVMEPDNSVAESTDVADVDSGAAEFISVQDSEYFAEVKLNRTAAHDAAMEELQAVLASAEVNSEVAVSTAGAIEELSNTLKMESDIESLVSAKTGSDCIAVISENTVEIVVSSDALTQTNVLQISDIISQVCSDKYENVKISGTYS